MVIGYIWPNYSKRRCLYQSSREVSAKEFIIYFYSVNINVSKYFSIYIFMSNVGLIN